MDFTVNGVEGGTRDSELQLDRPARVKVTLKAAANLDAIAERRRSATRRTTRSRTGTSSAPASASARSAGRGRRQRRGRRDAAARGRRQRPRPDVRRADRIAAAGSPRAFSRRRTPTRCSRWSAASRSARRARACSGASTAVNQCWTQKAPKIRASETRRRARGRTTTPAGVSAAPGGNRRQGQPLRGR